MGKEWLQQLKETYCTFLPKIRVVVHLTKAICASFGGVGFQLEKSTPSCVQSVLPWLDLHYHWKIQQLFQYPCVAKIKVFDEEVGLPSIGAPSWPSQLVLFHAWQLKQSPQNSHFCEEWVQFTQSIDPLVLSPCFVGGRVHNCLWGSTFHPSFTNRLRCDCSCDLSVFPLLSFF